MNILVHYRRSVSDLNKPFKNERGEVIEYDNVTLFYVELDRLGAGIVLPKDLLLSSAKIKTSDFEQTVGYTFEVFEESYADTFFGREISVWYEQVYSKLVPRRVEFGDDTYIMFTPKAQAYFAEIKEKLLPGSDSVKK